MVAGKEILIDALTIINNEFQAYIDPEMNCDAITPLSKQKDNEFNDYKSILKNLDYNVTVYNQRNIKSEEKPFNYSDNSTLRGSPNPFRNNLKILFTLNESSDIRLFITDLKGILVEEVITQKNAAAGSYEFDHYISKTNSGIYILNLVTNFNVQTLKLVVHNE